MVQTLRRLGQAIVLAFLAVDVAALTLPCPDVLLVDLGAGSEQCDAVSHQGAGSPPSPPASCPCAACHVSIAIGHPLPVAPALPFVELETLKPLAILNAIPTPIPPPPIA